MNIFNSLGSNYTWGTAMRHLFAFSGNKSGLVQFLENKYSGEVTLTYKGREALTLALQKANFPKGSFVAIVGITCYAVYQAIQKAGLQVQFLDIENDLQFSAESLGKALKSNSDIKAAVIQNTLGFPCDIKTISKVCRENGVILIEDLAHSLGSIYSNGQEAGTQGDYTVMSFSQDKVIDAVSGGALIDRTGTTIKNDRKLSPTPLLQQWKDRWYPLLTVAIRSTYALGMGKIMHFLFRKLRMLSQPMNSQGENSLRSLPGWYSSIILDQFNALESSLKHRHQIARIYARTLDKKLLFEPLIAGIENSTCLRFPILVEKRTELIQFLAQEGIFLSDIWYDAPIAPKRYSAKTSYSGECPQAEKIAEFIMNLPTHRCISTSRAEALAERINQWVESQ